MANSSSQPASFSIGERVLCYHGPLIYEAKILKLVRARRKQQGLKTTSNLALFNKIRSEEFKKLNDTEKGVWSDYANTVNEAALAAWENLPDDDILLR